MDDTLAFWAVPVDAPPPAAPTGPEAAGEQTPLPFAAAADQPGGEGFLLRGYDSPGEYFHPRLRSNTAA